MSKIKKLLEEMGDFSSHLKSEMKLSPELYKKLEVIVNEVYPIPLIVAICEIWNDGELVDGPAHAENMIKVMLPKMRATQKRVEDELSM